jgi:translocation and assembly module TamA
MSNYSQRGRSRVWRLVIAAVLGAFLWTVVLQAADKPLLSIAVEGLSGKELENVKSALKLPPGLIEEGKVDELLAGSFEEQAPKKVYEALQPFGYYQPEVKVSREKTEDGLSRLLIRVIAGNPIRLKAAHLGVTGPGSKEPMLLKFIADFPLKNGAILRQDIYEQAKGAFLKQAIGLGYLDAAFPTHEIRISLEHSVADIDLVLETGRRYRFGDVSFTGKPVYPEQFLRRYIEFQPGDPFSYEQMAKTQANFANADRFREIDVHARKEGAVDERIPVEVSLMPSQAKSVQAGVGYGTDTGPRATLRYRDVNVLGLAQELEAELKVSQILEGFSTRYILPGERDSRSYSALMAGAQREDTATYVSKWIKLEAERARGFGKYGAGSVFIQARKENSDTGDQSTNTFLLMPGGRFSDVHYDDAIRPHKGFSYQAELKGAHQSLGSSTGFIQIMASGDLIIPLPMQFSLITRARAGATWQNDPPQDLPVSVRFFAGGDRSVRGYAYQSLGPKDDKGNVVGGRHLLTGSVELARYIGKNWGVATFYDAGNAFNSLSDVSAAQGAGAGLRYYSPIGAINLDIARQIGVVEPDFRIHLTIGVGM